MPNTQSTSFIYTLTTLTNSHDHAAPWPGAYALILTHKQPSRVP